MLHIARRERCQLHIKWPLFSAKILQNAPVFGEKVVKKRPNNKKKYAVVSKYPIDEVFHDFIEKRRGFVAPFCRWILNLIESRHEDADLGDIPPRQGCRPATQGCCCPVKARQIRTEGAAVAAGCPVENDM